MSVCFNAINIHYLLVLFNAFVKISCGFVGGQLLFLLHAHLPWRNEKPKITLKACLPWPGHWSDLKPFHCFFSQVLPSRLLKSDYSPFTVLCYNSLKECLLVSLLMLWQLVTHSRGFPWAFSDCDGVGGVTALLTPLLCLWQAMENGLPWTQLNFKMYKSSTLGIVHGELFLTIPFSKSVKYWNIKGKI